MFKLPTPSPLGFLGLCLSLQRKTLASCVQVSQLTRSLSLPTRAKLECARQTQVTTLVAFRQYLSLQMLRYVIYTANLLIKLKLLQRGCLFSTTGMRLANSAVTLRLLTATRLVAYLLSSQFLLTQYCTRLSYTRAAARLNAQSCYRILTQQMPTLTTISLNLTPPTRGQLTKRFRLLHISNSCRALLHRNLIFKGYVLQAQISRRRIRLNMSKA